MHDNPDKEVYGGNIPEEVMLIGFTHEAVLVSEGSTSWLIRDNGYCYKVPKFQWQSATEEYPDPLDASRKYLERERRTQRVLLALGIPAIPDYNVETYYYTNEDGAKVKRVRARMTDLTDGGRNLVFSTPDITKQLGKVDPEGAKVWFGIANHRPIYNKDEFFDQLRLILDKSIHAEGLIARTRVHGVNICYPSGYFLVVRPNGTMATYIGDLDEIELRSRDPVGENPTSIDIRKHIPSEDKRYFRAISMYLIHVLDFFPELGDQVMQFLEEIEKTYVGQ